MKIPRHLSEWLRDDRTEIGVLPVETALNGRSMRSEFQAFAHDPSLENTELLLGRLEIVMQQDRAASSEALTLRAKIGHTGLIASDIVE